MGKSVIGNWLMGNGEWKKKVPLASFFSTPHGAETAAPRGCFANGGLSRGDTLPPAGTFGGYDVLRERRLG